MVDNTSEAGRQAVEQAQAAAEQSTALGPGTSGHTTTGAAYRGREVASNAGAPTPAEPGFGTTNGLNYNEGQGGTKTGYAPTQPFTKQPIGQ
ncbi:MAG TPA: hypothetical protein VNT75_11930 [Symbiobacteriaceae bacterium]|nr:hypothetical protein [Symbiobacteriaceae bacterium]